MKHISFVLLAAGMLALAGCSQKQEPDKPAAQEQQTLTAIQLASETSSLPAGNKASLTITTTPAGIALKASDFEISGGSLKVEGSKATFRAVTAGTWTIQAMKDDVKSNVITITTTAPESDSEESEPAADAAIPAPVEQAPVQEPVVSVPEDSQPAVSEDSQPVEETPAADSTSSSAGNTANRPVVTVKEVLADPAAYEGQAIILKGSLPQSTVPGPDGQPVMVIYPSAGDTASRLILSGDTDKINFGGCDARLTGILKSDGKGGYTFDVISGFPTSNGAAGDLPNRKPGEPADTLPDSGRFQFTSDKIRIRYGTDGLQSPASGKVFNSGMSVTYDGKYTKDGYTWITYTAASGKRCSVAVGTDKTIDYGFYAGK